MATGSEGGARATALAQPLVRESFVQLCVGPGDAQLNFTGDFTITFESPVGVGPALESPVVPYALEGIASLLPLLNADVTAVGVGDDGTITLAVGGTTIRCSADPSFEAWNYTGPGGRRVVSLPGVGLAIWEAV